MLLSNELFLGDRDGGDHGNPVQAFVADSSETGRLTAGRALQSRLGLCEGIFSRESKQKMGGRAAAAADFRVVIANDDGR